MHFDARAAKALEANAYIVIDGCLGLRLVASNTSKSWIYRYKSPVDGRMRQVKIGEWPAVAFPSAVAAWEGLKKQRDSGGDPSLDRKAGRNEKKAKAIEAKEGVYTVGRLVEDYITGYVVHHRIPANAKALASRLRRAVVPLENLEPTGVSRSVAFELIQGLADRPVMAGSVKQELGAAWEHAYDSGKLREDVPNWWRQILKGRLQSKGQLRDGVHKGTDKRVLTEEEIGRLIVKDYALLSPYVQDVLTLYLWTCTRGSEICALHADHISEEDGLLACWMRAPRSALALLKLPMWCLCTPMLRRTFVTWWASSTSASTEHELPSRHTSWVAARTSALSPLRNWLLTWLPVQMWRPPA